MAKQDPPHLLYPCQIQKPDIRRVHEPSDERPVVRERRVQRSLARLVAVLRS